MSRVMLAAGLLLCTPVFAADLEPDAASTVSTASTTSRFRLQSSTLEAAPQQSGRYAMTARFAPDESAGELREGRQFALIGRFAKAGVTCGPGLFANGFEGT